jgi:hypothetical protein
MPDRVYTQEATSISAEFPLKLRGYGIEVPPADSPINSVDGVVDTITLAGKALLVDSMNRAGASQRFIRDTLAPNADSPLFRLSDNGLLEPPIGLGDNVFRQVVALIESTEKDDLPTTRDLAYQGAYLVALGQGLTQFLDTDEYPVNTYEVPHEFICDTDIVYRETRRAFTETEANKLNDLGVYLGHSIDALSVVLIANVEHGEDPAFARQVCITAKTDSDDTIASTIWAKVIEKRGGTRVSIGIPSYHVEQIGNSVLVDNRNDFYRHNPLRPAGEAATALAIANGL